MQSSRTSQFLALALVAFLGLLPSLGHAAIQSYSQDFESLVQSDTNALANDGWLVFGNVFAAADTSYIYGYGPFPAPNDGFGFCQIDSTGQGGVEQGTKQLVVFSDYNNTDHGNGNWIESNVYHETTVEASDVGTHWIFEFQAKMGNLELESTAAAFIKTLDPSNGYALTNMITADMTHIPVTWGGYSISVDIDSTLVGQLLQFGFMNTATLYQGSGIYYDNLNFHEQPPTPAPSPLLARTILRQNVPNPFNPSTNISFSLAQPGEVDLSIYDVAGRRVARLLHEFMGAGDQTVRWNGRDQEGVMSASGRYAYVLTTTDGSTSRSMILLK